MLLWVGAILAIAVTLEDVTAHPGGLNSEGCHNDRANGTYHCHREPDEMQPAAGGGSRLRCAAGSRSVDCGGAARTERDATAAVSPVALGSVVPLGGFGGGGELERPEAMAGILAAWGALTIAPERTADDCPIAYSRSDYPYSQSVESQIRARLGGLIFGPYENRIFDTLRETQIEHIVALSEAHFSGLCAATDSRKRAFSRDLDNLTLASPGVNRSKSGRDAGEWLPAHNRCWFAARVVLVKGEYGLTVDAREHTALGNVLRGCASAAMRFGDNLIAGP